MKDILNISNELNYFVNRTEICFKLILPQPISYICMSFKLDENGNLNCKQKNDQHFCQRCNSKLEYIETYISIFSENKEKILKCKNCGWC
jgi:hypothetical protein